MTRRQSWFDGEAALQRILTRRLGGRVRGGEAPALAHGRRWRPTRARCGRTRPITTGPKLVVRDRTGERIDEIEYHHSYRQLQELGYGGGIVAGHLRPGAGQGARRRAQGAHLRARLPLRPGGGGPVLPDLHDRRRGDAGRTSSARRSCRSASFPGSPPPTCPRSTPARCSSPRRRPAATWARCTTVAKGGKNVPGEQVTLSGDKWFCSQRRRRRDHDPRAARGRRRRHPGPGPLRAPAHLENGKRNALPHRAHQGQAGRAQLPHRRGDARGRRGVPARRARPGLPADDRDAEPVAALQRGGLRRGDAALGHRGAGVGGVARRLRQERHQPPADDRDADGHGLRAARWRSTGSSAASS